MGHHGRAQCVGPQIPDFLQVVVVVGRPERAARDGVVVVEHYAAQFGGGAIEQQSVGLCGLDGAEPCADGYPVALSVVRNSCRDGVERRMAGTP